MVINHLLFGIIQVGPIVDASELLNHLASFLRTLHNDGAISTISTRSAPASGKSMLGGWKGFNWASVGHVNGGWTLRTMMDEHSGLRKMIVRPLRVFWQQMLEKTHEQSDIYYGL